MVLVARTVRILASGLASNRQIGSRSLPFVLGTAFPALSAYTGQILFDGVVHAANRTTKPLSV